MKEKKNMNSTKDISKMALAVECPKEIVPDGNWIPEIGRGPAVNRSGTKSAQRISSAAGVSIRRGNTAWALCRRVCTQTLLHKEAFTHRSSQKLLHTDAFTHRCFYTQTRLHTEVFTPRSLYTQKRLHTDAFTQTLLNSPAFTHRHF